MSDAAIFGASYGSLGLVAFYLIVRRYHRRLKDGSLSRSWDGAGVFCFGVVMGVLWPLTFLWSHATRPTREERQAVQQRRLRKLMDANDRRARHLGITEGASSASVETDGTRGANFDVY